MRQEIKAIVLIAIGAFLVFAMFASGAGVVGESVSYACKGVLGAMAYVLPFVLAAYGVAIFANKGYRISMRSHLFVALIFVMLTLFICAFSLAGSGDPLGGASVGRVFDLSAAGRSGGVVGMFLGSAIIGLIGKPGLFILSVAVLVVSGLLLARTTLSERFEYINSKRAQMRERREAREEELRRLEEAEARARESAYRAMPERKAGQGSPGHGAPGQSARPQRTITEGTEFASASMSDHAHAPAHASVSAHDPAHAPAEGGEEYGGGSAYAGSGFKAFLGGLLSKKQENIIDAVMNDEQYISGSTGLPIENEEELGAGQGYGIEPYSVPKAGMGLGDYADSMSFATGVGAASGVSHDAGAVSREDGAEAASAFDADSAAAAVRETADAKTSGPREDTSPEWIDSSAHRQEGPALGLEPADSGFKRKRNRPYKLPPISLLKKSQGGGKPESERELRAQAKRLEEILKEFRVEAKVLKVTVGPTVTRYEAEPDVGVKIQSIKSLESDLALRLEVKSVRVVPMPSQAVVGIEAYNSKRNIVTLREIIDSPDFTGKESKLSFVLGKNISGERIIGDLAEMPHLLIAGTTGSGKSVCINSILLSIMYKATPDEVKLILVDPKVVELKPYSDIPHLLLPVVTSPERAATALGYAVTIMNERYTKFAEYNVRNLAGYNELMIREGNPDEVLPQIVIVIDELSDLMMIAPQKVQESISRLAAMARAAGMHLIVATQQPLASILTSVIKANIPSRIAFSVSSNSASRVILDAPGAEHLHGKGDMLFSPVGVREPMRVQGSFVSESEVYKVTEHVKKEMDPEYSPDILDAVSGATCGDLTEDEDDLFRDAVEAVVAAKQASVSMLQRRFRIGYNRSARLVDMMEERGMVAPSDGTNKPRKVLMTEAQFESFMKNDGAGGSGVGGVGGGAGGAAGASGGGAFASGAGAAASASGGGFGAQVASVYGGNTDVGGAQIADVSHAMYGGVPGGAPSAGDGEGFSSADPDTPVKDISDLFDDDDDDPPPFDRDDDE
jgi:S-DNA-T family DNA segregation ATPase FtsK/SpoIIIE